VEDLLLQVQELLDKEIQVVLALQFVPPPEQLQEQAVAVGQVVLV
jgi:hypothetical protein